MQTEIDTSKYYNAHDVLTYNAMYNFIVGGRGIGKTFDAKYRRIQHFLKTGMQFIYLRRYKTEFDDKDMFFSDLVAAGKFPDYEFKVHGMRGYVRKRSEEEDDGVEWYDDEDEQHTKKRKARNPWRCCCYFVTLSTALTKKSVPYKSVDYIIFDEFIIDKGHIHYLNNELKQFLDFYNTVDRYDDRVRVMFLANAVALTNPYFVGFNLTPRKDQRFTRAKGGLIIIEMCSSEKFIQHVDNTKFGKLISGTSYYNYAVSNEFKDDNDRMIAPKPDDAMYWFTFTFDGESVSVWRHWPSGSLYLSRKIPNNTLPLVLTRDDMQPNLLMIEKTSPFMSVIRKLYMQGSVYFDSIQTREFCSNVFDYIGLR